jgi:Flp pilus assembly protein TadG
MKALIISARGGAAAIEYALLLPVLLLFVLGIADVGRLLWTQVTLDRAVETAARCSAVDKSKCLTIAQTQSYAAGQAQPLHGISSSNFTVCSDASCSGSCVSASYVFNFIVPWNVMDRAAAGPGTLTLTSESCYPL